MVDSCRIWERHREPEIQPRTSVDRRPVRVICQVAEDEPTPANSAETESVGDMIRRLLPTPAPPPLQAALTHSDRDLLIQLMETICPPKLVAQERSSTNDLETPLLNWFPVGTVTEVPTRTFVRLHRGVFFVRRVEPFYGAMPHSR